jgi:radical SAM superfamily enzyme YgiQ (UPF0313 family)
LRVSILYTFRFPNSAMRVSRKAGMRITLVFPPFYLQSLYNLPPLGLLNLATILRPAGHDVSVLDLVLAIRLKMLSPGASIYEDSVGMILREEPDLVAFSAQCATLPGVIRIAEILKGKKPGLRIVVGGHDVSFVDEQALERFPWIDAVVRGEGEITLRELAAAFAKGEAAGGIEGVTWRRGAEIFRNPDRELLGNLDELPIPDYSFVPGLDLYRDACAIPRAIAILEAGRGCPHQCVYCSESVMWRRRSRTFSIPRIVQEMRRLRDDFGAECFLLAYDQFTADRKFVEGFCHHVLEAGLDTTPWYCISRLDSVDRPLLRLMREAGCESMCYGIDSGSERTLNFIGKHIDEGILYQRVRETTDEGMVPTLSFVVGFPEEEREDIDKTLSLALRAGIQGNSNPLIQMPTVLPGTELHRRYGERLIRSADTYFSLGLEFDNGHRLEVDSRLIESYPLIFSGFHNLPCSGLALEELEQIASWFPLLVNLYPKSFLLLSLALDTSISALFSQFVDYVAKAEGRTTNSLTPADCRRHLPAFADWLPVETENGSWRHLPEVVSYESTMLESGSGSPARTAGTADLCMLEEWFPSRSASAVVREFRHDLTAIIADLKEGIFRDRYDESSTILVFMPDGNGLEVTEINAFGRDLLALSDGSWTVEEITGELFHRFGAGMDPARFRNECREAVAMLTEMNLLHGASCAPTRRKEVISC